MDKYFPIGTPVAYTHRACGVVWCRETRELDDLGHEQVVDEAHWMWSKRDTRWRPEYSVDANPQRPLRGRIRTGGTPTLLDRWVYVWPESGEGFVIGLTFRSEGFRDPGGISNRSSYYDEPDYEPPYLVERQRYPLYEIRSSLRARSVLCPTWAVAKHSDVINAKMAEIRSSGPLPSRAEVRAARSRTKERT